MFRVVHGHRWPDLVLRQRYRDSFIMLNIWSWFTCPPFEPIMMLSSPLTHWGRVTHICVSKLTTIIDSDNGLLPDRRQAIIWTNAGLLLIGPLGTNFSEILIGILTFSFKKMRLKVSSAKRRPLCLGLNVLKWTRCQVRLRHWSLNKLSEILQDTFSIALFDWILLASDPMAYIYVLY